MLSCSPNEFHANVQYKIKLISMAPFNDFFVLSVFSYL